MRGNHCFLSSIPPTIGNNVFFIIIIISYIPQLEKMDPEYWGIAVHLIDGQTWSLGDDEVEFSIQSCCKPLMYCLACEELGSDEVRLLAIGNGS